MKTLVAALSFIWLVVVWLCLSMLVALLVAREAHADTYVPITMHCGSITLCVTRDNIGQQVCRDSAGSTVTATAAQPRTEISGRVLVPTASESTWRAVRICQLPTVGAFYSNSGTTGPWVATAGGFDGAATDAANWEMSQRIALVMFNVLLWVFGFGFGWKTSHNPPADLMS